MSESKRETKSASEHLDGDCEQYHSFEVSGKRFELTRRYKMLKPIGSGAYGTVIAAEDTESGENVAIKLVRNIFNDAQDAKKILREIRLLRHLEHQHILDVRDLIPPRHPADFSEMYIVTRLMETDLHRVIYSKQPLSDDHIQYFLYQALLGLLFIHSADCIHRDLKPSNLLVNSDCELRICDFGLARGIEEDINNALTEYVVTRWYRAPEIMLSCRHYNKAIDVWSLGCIFGELLGRKPLFPGNHYMHQLQLIVSVLGNPTDDDLSFVTSDKALKFMKGLPKKPADDFSKMFPAANPVGLDLLQKMLAFHPEKRISVIDCLNHPYFDSIRSAEEDFQYCKKTFEFQYERDDPSKEILRWLLMEEIRDMHPEIAPLPKPEFPTNSNPQNYFK